MISKVTPVKDYNKYPFMDLSFKNRRGEEWVDVPQFGGYISVSNYGRIWAMPREIHAVNGQVYFTKERIMKQTLVRGYNSYTKDYTEQLRVHIRFEGESHKFLVNRLVYDIFVAPLNDSDGLAIVHKDGDNCNNYFKNLVAMNGTQLYEHGLKLERRPKSGRKIKKGKKNIWSDSNSPRPVVQYTLSGKRVRMYESLEMASKKTGAHRASIRRVIQKKSIQLHGFVYRHKGDPYKGEYADFSWQKPVTQYTIEGKKVAHYLSVTEASKKTKIDAKTISKGALKKSRFGSGFVWRYAGEIYKGEFKGIVRNKARAIVQYSLDGIEVARYNSANQASTATGFSAPTILDSAHKRSKLAHNYVWRFEGEAYKGEYKNHQRGLPVAQYSKQGKLIEIFHTIAAAAEKTGLTPDNIQKNVKGENKTAGGFVWKKATRQQIKGLPVFVLSSKETDFAGKEVIQYSLEGKLLARHISISAAARTVGMNATNISVALDKPNRSSGGFVWRTKGVRYFGELARNPNANKAQRVTQYDLKGKKLGVFKSTVDAERKTGVSSSTISAVARGKLNTTGGFIWQYGDGPKKIDLKVYYASSQEKLKRMSKPVVKYSIDGERLKEYPSIAAAAREEEVRVGSISSAINGSSKSAAGFLWKLQSA